MAMPGGGARKNCEMIYGDYHINGKVLPLTLALSTWGEGTICQGRRAYALESGGEGSREGKEQ